MNNLREVNDDILKDWLEFREETLYCTLSAEDNGKVNIKLMKKYKIKLTKKFNIDFPITGSLKPAIGFYFFIFYFQFLLTYLLVCMMVLLFL